MHCIDKVKGCLLMGLAGDVVGSRVEGKTSLQIEQEFGYVASLKTRYYTDDTEMTLGVLNYLKKQNFSLDNTNPQDIMEEYCNIFTPKRGYSGSTREVLTLFKENPKENWPKSQFNKSTHNGAVMRIAPLGCLNVDVKTEIVDFIFYTHNSMKALLACWLHCLSIHHLIHDKSKNVLEFLEFLHKTSSQYYEAEHIIKTVKTAYQKTKFQSQCVSINERLLGKEDAFQIEALDAWGCALYSFCISYDNPEFVIPNAISLGGDTDTIAKMAGELAGAKFGTRILQNDYCMAEGYEQMKNLAEELAKTVYKNE